MKSWYKKAQNVRWFEWEDPNSSDVWVISYRNIEPDELYGEDGRSLSDEQIMKNMITGIQHKWSDESLTPPQIEYWFNKFQLTPDEFFEEVQDANNLFRDEQWIEQRDIDMELK